MRCFSCHTAAMLSLEKHPRLVYCGAWALAGLYNFCRDVLSFPWQELALFNVAHFAVWACLGLIALPLLRRYPLRRAWRPWLLHLALGALLVQVDITLGHLIFFKLTGHGAGLDLAAVARVAFANCFHLALMTYWIFVGIVQLIDAGREVRRRTLEAAQARHAAVLAQLQALRAQLQPHFLFNTLNGIAAVMHEDVDMADRMLNRLADLLRMSLNEGDAPVIRLQQELAFINAYLEIEKMRFGQRLDVHCHVPDSLLGCEVPPFILQPLVENAIKHGVASRASGGRIRIRAFEGAQGLQLEVEDDGAAQAEGEGGFRIGLRNTRERLQALYGSSQGLELLRGQAGMVARIHLPMQRRVA